jgi:hypothetical protein
MLANIYGPAAGLFVIIFIIALVALVAMVRAIRHKGRSKGPREWNPPS